jgi:hypothetical protein
MYKYGSCTKAVYPLDAAIVEPTIVLSELYSLILHDMVCKFGALSAEIEEYKEFVVIVYGFKTLRIVRLTSDSIIIKSNVTYIYDINEYDKKMWDEL